MRLETIINLSTFKVRASTLIVVKFGFLALFSDLVSYY